MKILVTGATGFIGSAFVRRCLSNTAHKIRGLCRSTRTRNGARLLLEGEEQCCRFEQINGDLLGDLTDICDGCDAVVNFAAKTFVDHSIRDPAAFVETNVVGTHKLLEDARRCRVKHFVQISTDEVYGSILNGAYDESARLNPSNPYAASKAAADMLALAYANTYGMLVTVTRTENNYGPYQGANKVFPVFVRKALAGEPLPVYGDGGHVRQWLWVDDHVDAVLMLLAGGRSLVSGVFHVAGAQELTNLKLAEKIVRACGREWNQDKCVRFVPDHDIRPGHDRRYALRCDRMRSLGWEPKVNLGEGIERAVRWYRDNPWWGE